MLAAICLITFFCFQPSVHNQFTNWDDDVYVTNDTVIRTLTPAHLKTIFTQDITRNNYHPFCMLSLAVNYHFAGLKPYSYYLTNILIHIANVVLVFFLFMALFKKTERRAESGERKSESALRSVSVSALGALWFGIHPLHVESVSWIAERKDVLYAFFYFLGLLVYINGGKRFIVFLLFLASCLSKPMAVVFPLSLLTIDFLTGRKIEWQWRDVMHAVSTKTPFFIAALAMGALAFYTQNKTGAIAAFSKLTITERIMYASYGFVMYIYKFFNPAFLSTFYPYPYHFLDGSLPFIYYASPFIAIVIITVPVYISYKFSKQYFKVTVFGMGFFTANIIFVLQFISVGAAIMADRYFYVSSVGILFMAAFFVNEMVVRFPQAKLFLLSIAIAFSAFLAILCYQRTAVWRNSETLESDAIKKYPYRALLSYKWLGNYYYDRHDTVPALAADDTAKQLENYSVLAQLNSADAKIYDRIGNIYLWRNDYKTALDYFNKSLMQENNVYITYIDRSMAYSGLADTLNSRKDYIQAMELNRAEAEKRFASMSFNMVQAKKYKPLVIQYNLLLMLNPGNPYYYFYRGVAYYSTGNLTKAIADFKTAMKFNNPEVSKAAEYNLKQLKVEN